MEELKKKKKKQREKNQHCKEFKLWWEAENKNQAWKKVLTPTSKSQADTQTFGSSPRTQRTLSSVRTPPYPCREAGGWYFSVSPFSPMRHKVMQESHMPT